MILEFIEVKPETRCHKGFFVQEAPYKLVEIDSAGWALICMNEAICYYVDPDNLELTNTEAETVAV